MKSTDEAPITERPEPGQTNVTLVLERIEARLATLETIKTTAHRTEEANDQTARDVANALQDIARALKVGEEKTAELTLAVRANTQGIASALEAVSGLSTVVLGQDSRLDRIEKLAERAVRASDHVNLRG